MRALTQTAGQRLAQTLTITPQMVLVSRLLQMGAAELDPFINRVLESNPLLERADDAIMVGNWQKNTALPNTYQENPAQNFDATLLIQAPKTLRDHVMEQVIFTFKDAHERRIATMMGDYLDEAGYLCTPLSDIAQNLTVDPARLVPILTKLQRFDPAGIFARNLSECLMLQLERQGKYHGDIVALLEHLPLLARRDFVALSRLCQIPASRIIAAFKEIRLLNPKPGLAFSHDLAADIIPDAFIVERQDGVFQIELNHELMPKLTLNNNYTYHIATTPEERHFLKNCQHQARWLLQALDQRAHTLLLVIQTIIACQEDFLRHGVIALKPLTLGMIAEKLSLHVSTISRVTAGKYVTTPRGTFALRHFLSHAPTPSQNGAQHASQAIQEQIRRLIEQERADHILSDEALVALLEKQGINIARRTVTKYREAMGIPASTKRKKEKKWLAAHEVSNKFDVKGGFAKPLHSAS